MTDQILPRGKEKRIFNPLNNFLENDTPDHKPRMIDTRESSAQASESAGASYTIKIYKQRSIPFI